MTDSIRAWLDHTRTALPAATAAIRAVLNLHTVRQNTVSALYPIPLCNCGKEWPCPTVQAITTALCDHTNRGITWTENGTTAYACDTCQHEWIEEP